MRTLAALLTIALLALAQDPPVKKDAQKTGKVKPLPAGQTKVLAAIVMEVKGVAQARANRNEKWQKLKVNDQLVPGTVIRTGRKSMVALRVGSNATVLVERQSRVSLPEIVQDGQVLRTRVAMSFGRADVRVDRVGLRNDFEVATPTATLAVRGTTARIEWSAVAGAEMTGIPNNRLRAVEVKYLSGETVALSGGDATSTTYTFPATKAFLETFILPLEGAIGASEYGTDTQGGFESIVDPRRENTALDNTVTGGGGKGSLGSSGSSN